jgi:hypothetical protein
VKGFRLVVFFEAAFSGASFAANGGESDSESETGCLLHFPAKACS